MLLIPVMLSARFHSVWSHGWHILSLNWDRPRNTFPLILGTLHRRSLVEMSSVFMTTKDKCGQWAQWFTALTSSPTGDDRTEKRRGLVVVLFIQVPVITTRNQFIFYGSKNQCCHEVRYLINMAGFVWFSFDFHCGWTLELCQKQALTLFVIKISCECSGFTGGHRIFAKGIFMKRSCLSMFVYVLSCVADGGVNDGMFLCFSLTLNENITARAVNFYTPTRYTCHLYIFTLIQAEKKIRWCQHFYLPLSVQLNKTGRNRRVSFLDSKRSFLYL